MKIPRRMWWTLWTIAWCVCVSESVVVPEYGGWKALRRHFPRKNQTRDIHSGNGDQVTPDGTRRSFMLVYPPKPELRGSSSPPSSPPPSSSEKHRPSNTISSQPTSHHQVQVQLLDGYALPPGSFEVSNYQSLRTESGAPGELRVSPVFIGDVPEIRLILPGDVHRQLKELDANSRQKTAPHQQRISSGSFTKKNSTYSFVGNNPSDVSQSYSYRHGNSNKNFPLNALNNEYSHPDLATMSVHHPVAKSTSKPTVLLESSYWPSNGVTQPQNNYLNNPVHEHVPNDSKGQRWGDKENNNSSKRLHARHLSQNFYHNENTNMQSKITNQRHYISNKGSGVPNENYGYNVNNNNNNNNDNNNNQFKGYSSTEKFKPMADNEDNMSKTKGYQPKKDCGKNKNSGKVQKSSNDKPSSSTSTRTTTTTTTGAADVLGASQQKTDDIYQQPQDEENLTFLFAPSAEQATQDPPSTMGKRATSAERTTQSNIPKTGTFKVADAQGISLQLMESTFGACAPVMIGSGEKSFENIREAARIGDADDVFDFLNVTEDEVQNMLSEHGARALFLPSNEALSRIPSIISEPWRKRPEGFFKNAMVTTIESLQNGGSQSLMISHLRNGNLRLNSASGILFVDSKTDDEAVTVNGRRLVRGDIMLKDGQVLHVVDNLLCPAADRDIIETVRSCGKYDGFLTLAHVTGLMTDLQTDGPFTVFLPSNNALSKIPEDELAILKENVTALKDFLEYHVVEGLYFSGNLMDGQYLPTLRQSTHMPLKVGIRVDGCKRRLIEVNHSPILKTDIPTKNGVIHVVDWILRPGDLEWCQDVFLP